MGMYTGIRFKAELSPLGKQMVEALYGAHCGSGDHDPWPCALKVLIMTSDTTGPGRNDEAIRAVGLWCAEGRASFIPFGAICYLDESWEEKDFEQVWKDVQEGKAWEVCCSLKNYQDEIEQFVDKVLPHLIKSPCVVETQYEGAEKPTVTEVLPFGQHQMDY